MMAGGFDAYEEVRDRRQCSSAHMEVDSRPDFVCNVTTTMTPFMKLLPIEARMWL
jgi:hypothetical protein